MEANYFLVFQGTENKLGPFLGGKGDEANEIKETQGRARRGKFIWVTEMRI